MGSLRAGWYLDGALMRLLFFYLALVPIIFPQSPTAPHGIIGTPTAGGGGTTFTVVETVGTAATTTAACVTSGVTLTFGTATTSGEAIFVAWEEESAGGTTAITDSASDSYTKDWELTAFVSHQSTGLAHFFNVASGVTTVTVTGAASNTHCVAAATHVKRSSGSWAVDQTGAASNTSVNGSPWAGPTSGITTTANNEVLIGEAGIHGSGDCSVAASGNWVQAYGNYDNNGYAMQLSYQKVSSIQTAIQNTGTTTVCTSPNAAPGLVSYK